MLKSILVFLSALVVWDHFATNGTYRHIVALKIAVWVHWFFELDWLGYLR